jgi:hypothetical protein
MWAIKPGARAPGDHQNDLPLPHGRFGVGEATWRRCCRPDRASRYPLVGITVSQATIMDRRGKAAAARADAATIDTIHGAWDLIFEEANCSRW